MSITTFSSRRFNHDAGKAKKAAKSGPVFITNRGRPTYVLLTFVAYQKISRQQIKIADLLAMPTPIDAELELPQSRELAKPADLS